MTDPKFLKELDVVYEEGKLYDYLTKYNVGDNLNINPFRVALLLESLYSRIEQLERELEYQKEYTAEQNERCG